MVDCIREFISFIWNTWVENKFHAIADQPGYMTMCKLRRITFGFTWDGFNTQFVNLSVGSRREYNLILQFCKERIPERIIPNIFRTRGIPTLPLDALSAVRGL